MKLKEVVPWGRGLAEYRLMFDLSDDDLGLSILGCADGPASFNRELSAGQVVSVDPVYQFSRAELEQRISDCYFEVMSEVQKNQQNFVWTFFKNPAKLAQARMEAMNLFLDDFERGKQQDRYRVGSLPTLDFSDNQFDLALCSHFLFLYSDLLSLEFHLASIRELCRVAKEVRIFPLLELSGYQSVYVHRVLSELRKSGLMVEVNQVAYEFQKGANKMMRIYHK